MIILQHSKEFPNLGKLYVNERFQCYTLDPLILRAGTYRLEMTYSPKFKRELPLITGAMIGPERGFRIHAGNSLKDSQGCILVGDTFQVDSAGNVKLLNSKKALEALLKEDLCQMCIY